MDSTIWAAVIGAIASVLLFVAGAIAATLKGPATDRQAAVNEARTTVQELLRAALDAKAALTLREVRRRNKRPYVIAMVQSVAQMLVGFIEPTGPRGAADGLDTALAWRRAVNAAEEAITTSSWIGVPVRGQRPGPVGHRQHYRRRTPGLCRPVPHRVHGRRHHRRRSPDRRHQACHASAGEGRPDRPRHHRRGDHRARGHRRQGPRPRPGPRHPRRRPAGHRLQPWLLLKTLQQIDGPVTQFNLTTPTKPALLHGVDQADKFRGLIMPIRLTSISG